MKKIEHATDCKVKILLAGWDGYFKYSRFVGFFFNGMGGMTGDFTFLVTAMRIIINFHIPADV